MVINSVPRKVPPLSLLKPQSLSTEEQLNRESLSKNGPANKALVTTQPTKR